MQRCDSPIVLIESPSAEQSSENESDDGVIVLIEPAQFFGFVPDILIRTSSDVGCIASNKLSTASVAVSSPTRTTTEISSSSHPRKKRGRAVPYEFTATPSAGEARLANVPVIGKGVIIKPSSIANSGNGLFADTDFKRGDLITEYVGEILDRDEVELRCRLGQFQYIGTLRPQQYYIDGIREPVEGLGGASFINHSESASNSAWLEIEDKRLCFTRKFARATRDIKRGEEIFANYGRTYWSRMKRWYETIEREGLDGISDFEGEVDCECDYTDFMKAPNPVPPQS